jgi:twitching motility protein PilI
MSVAEPFALLQEMDRRCRAGGGAAFAPPEQKPEWRGVLFRIGDQVLAVAESEISEMLTWPTLTRVPWVLPWLRGVANVRGELLPLVDMSLFLGGASISQSKQARVLVMRHRLLHAGLLVHEVLGLRRFLVETFERSIPADLGPEAGACITGSYAHEGRRYGVFSVQLLAELPQFLRAAA